MFDFVFSFTPVQVYVVMVILMFTNGLFLLPSSQGILVISGIAASVMKMNFVLLFVLLVVSNVLGNYVLYLIAYKWGERAVMKILPVRKKRLDEDIVVTKYLFEKYGEVIIFVGRNLTVLHSLVSVPAGIAKTGQKKFLLFTSLGILVWSVVFFSLGMYLGSDYENIFGLFNVILMSVTLIGTVGAISYFALCRKRILKRARVHGGVL